MKNLRKRLACLLLSALLLIGCLPVTALAAENGFILVVEAGGKLVIAPEYISCTAGQTAAQALSASGHTFTGLDTGMISAIDGVTGNFTRSDENGNYDLSVSAASIGYLRFSEDMDSKPSDGLKQLMTAMADYKKKDSDVQAAAKKEYGTARDLFVGINGESAKTLAFSAACHARKLFHQLFHISELFYQAVDFCDVHACALCDSFLAGRIHQIRVAPLFGCHRKDDRLHASHRLLIFI